MNQQTSSKLPKDSPQRLWASDELYLLDLEGETHRWLSEDFLLMLASSWPLLTVCAGSPFCDKSSGMAEPCRANIFINKNTKELPKYPHTGPRY